MSGFFCYVYNLGTNIFDAIIFSIHFMLAEALLLQSRLNVPKPGGEAITSCPHGFTLEPRNCLVNNADYDLYNGELCQCLIPRHLHHPLRSTSPERGHAARYVSEQVGLLSSANQNVPPQADSHLNECHSGSRERMRNAHSSPNRRRGCLPRVSSLESNPRVWQRSR